MTSFISHTTIDCRDPHTLSQWWGAVLGYVEDPQDPCLPGADECEIHDPETGHAVLFLAVPEPKETKNRIHFDLRPRTGTRDHELSRLLAHGTTQISDHRGQYGPGTGWIVLADPEGNEFCLLRSQDEVDRGPSPD